LGVSVSVEYIIAGYLSLVADLGELCCFEVLDAIPPRLAVGHSLRYALRGVECEPSDTQTGSNLGSKFFLSIGAITELVFV